MSTTRFEPPKMEPPKVTRAAVSRVVHEAITRRQLFRTLQVDHVTIPAQDFSARVLRAAEQIDILGEKSIAQPIVSLASSDSNNQQVYVPIELPDPNNMEQYHHIVNSLQNNGMPVYGVDKKEAFDILEDGITDFVTQRAKMLNSAIVAPNPVTVVNSKRAGDTILFSQGFFLSTQTAFGVSTPAQRFLAAGRYCFGILESTGPRFEQCLWSVPSNSTIWVQLP